jgi:hypothetical protein
MGVNAPAAYSHPFRAPLRTPDPTAGIPDLRLQVSERRKILAIHRIRGLPSMKPRPYERRREEGSNKKANKPGGRASSTDVLDCAYGEYDHGEQQDGTPGPRQ